MALSRPAAASRDLVACAAVLALGGLLALLGAPVAVRAAVEVPLVLFVPGYLVVVAAFPSAPPPLLRAVLAAASSLAICAVGSVALDAAGVRLGRASFVALLELVGVGALLVASGRRRHGRAPAPPVPWRSAWPAAALVALLVAAVGAGVVTARALPRAHDITGSSTLWALPATQGRATIGVRSLEVTPATFRVVVRADARVVSRWRVRLAPGARWQRTIAVPRGADPQVELARDGQPTLEHVVDLEAGAR